jgi:hypothetical protein
MRLTTKMITAAAAFTLATAPLIRPVHASSRSVAAVAIDHATPLLAGVAATNVTQNAKIEVKTTESHSAWYTQPVWIAIGIVALVLIIALIAMAGRRNGGTTVVK